MQTENRLLDDLAKLAAGAVGGLTGMRHEFESRMRHQIELMLGGMNLVGREEFEVVKAMAAKARTEQEAMIKRLAALEAKLEGTSKRHRRPKQTDSDATAASQRTGPPEISGDK